MIRISGVVALAVMAGAALAADLVVSDSHQTGARDCGGGIATISGSNNALQLRGCRQLVVNGNHNRIGIEAAASIQLLGNDNQVTWSGADKPRIGNLGSRNRVTAGVVSDAGDAAVSSQSARDAAADALQTAADANAAANAALGGAGEAGQVAQVADQALAGLAVVEADDHIELSFGGDILFDFNSTAIRPSAAAQLDRAAQLIRERAVGRVMVVGHTDAIGDAASNQRLSEQRAASVVSSLQRDGGIEASRLRAAGLGESRPVAPNAFPDGRDNPEGRQLNRRVAIFLATRPDVDIASIAGVTLPEVTIASQPKVTTSPVTGDAVSCAAGRTCRADCEDGNCAMTCPAGAICEYACSGGDCRMQCSAGADCDFSCSGGNCQHSCAAGARCRTSCKGGECSK